MKIICFIIALSFFACAQSVSTELKNCQKVNPTTQGCLECFNIATSQWDSVLNIAYKELRNKLAPPLQEKLKLSQTAWLSFRDKEISFLNDAFAYNQKTTGSEVQLYRSEYVMNLTKDRVLLLQEYLKGIKDISEDGSP
jgi:uncharacterized protein YecT (DUF1311 family)